MTGERLKGSEVIGLGLATHYIPSSEYETLVHHLTGLEFQSYMTQEERDEIIHESLEELETDEARAEVDPEYLATVERIFGAQNDDDSVEGIIARLTALDTPWAHETLATLEKMAPLSLKVTLEQMRQGAVKNCAECFQMEYRIATRMMENPDFFEGVRSVIVDKDRSPKWAKKDVAHVTREEVLHFFEPLDEDKELVLYDAASE